MEAFIEKFGDRLKVEMFEIGRNLGEARGEARGQAKGKAEAIVMLLRKRGVATDEAAVARILGCGDISMLDRWFDRAITVTSVQDLFGE